MVISTSARSGGAYEEPWDVFAQRRVVSSEGYPGNFPSSEVLRRARSLIGAKYDVLVRNCEHFITYAHGYKPQSIQVVLTLVFVAAGVVALMAAR